MKLKGARVLITQAHLVRFMGSEIVTLELAEYFDAAGADVVVVTHTFGGPLRNAFARLERVRVFEMPDPELEELWQSWIPDIAWIHHSVLPAPVLERADRILFLFHHMSAYLPIERPLAPDLEREIATASTFISEEAKASQLESGLYDDIEPARLQTFENPAPARFQARRRYRPIRHLVVVSNHLPPELLDAVRELRSRMEVTLVGAQREHGATPRLVDPALLEGADAIVSIGKTVQFAMAAEMPVYVYDHFGGPGWLSEDNFSVARHHGFSGRGFDRKTGAQIAAELGAFDAAAWNRYCALLQRHSADFRLPERVSALLKFAASNPRPVSVPAPERILAHSNLLSAFGSYVREWVRMEGDALYRKELVDQLEDRLKLARAELQMYRSIPGHRLLRRVLGGFVKSRLRRAQSTADA